METLAIILKTSCVSFLALYVVLALRDGWAHANARFSVLACVTIAALFLQSSALPVWIALPLRLIDACNIAFVWWSCLALLEEDFELRPVHWLGLLTYGASTVPYRFAVFGIIEFPPVGFSRAAEIITLVFVAHLIWRASQGYREDLIEKRRGLRIIFILACAMAIAISIFGQYVFHGQSVEQGSLTLTAAVTLPIAFALNVWLLRFHPEILLFQPISRPALRQPSVDPQDAVAHARLIEIIEVEKAYTEHGLTIGALAQKVGIPEHQLRTLINRSMGHRNFASFLNGYRLAYAKEILADPAEARLPVLTIAMDAGFASLAPFNRAFKAAEGITPTAFRAQTAADRN